MLETYTINAVGIDGHTYPIYFECEDDIDAENIVRQTGLVPDEAGICKLIYEYPEDESIIEEKVLLWAIGIIEYVTKC